LFGAITGKDIADEVNKKFNINIDKKKVVIDTIKQLGTYDVEIKLYPEISTKVKVVIEEK
jgi:large subunit ribosomal protein L9